MTLAASGTLSIGGTTANRSINLELGRSATATSSLGEASLRTLAGVSGNSTISISNFYGKSNFDWSPSITVGTTTFSGQNFRGYSATINGGFGSTTDSSCDLYSTNPTWGFYDTDEGNTFFYVYDTSGTPTGNAGWTSITTVGTTLAGSNASAVTTNRTSCSYFSPAPNIRFWDLGYTATTPASGSQFQSVLLGFVA